MEIRMTDASLDTVPVFPHDTENERILSISHVGSRKLPQNIPCKLLWTRQNSRKESIQVSFQLEIDANYIEQIRRSFQGTVGLVGGDRYTIVRPQSDEALGLFEGSTGVLDVDRKRAAGVSIVKTKID